MFTCSNHLVLPVIYLKFKAHDLLGYLPEVLVQHLEEIYSLNRDRNLQIIEQIKAITATLNQAGISPLFMKGTGNLVDGVYSDVGERIIGDIDFLVPEKDFLTAAELFEKEGYEICFPAYLPYDQMKHYPRLWKEDVIAEIEIHRLPVTLKYTTHFSADFVLNSKKSVAGFPGCYVLADDHKVILNFIHSQLSNSGHALGTVSLRDVYDNYCLSKLVDPQWIAEISPFERKYNAYSTIARKLLGIPILDKLSLTSKVFCWKHDQNLISPFFRIVNRIPWAIGVFIFIVIPMKLKEFINYKEARQIIIHKFGSKDWYTHKLKIYKKKITG
ncbi:MAG: nucleotidyltransferase family protein [Mariniphaga sp.]|nr:nucleotidyltransferase family protein [Mariniphaga sp.]